VPAAHANPVAAGKPMTEAMCKAATEAMGKAVTEAMVEMIEAPHKDD
jgi:hypothetical protein